MKQTSLILIFLLMVSHLFAQQKKTKYGASPYFQQLKRKHPEIERKRRLMEQKTKNFQENESTQKR